MSLRGSGAGSGELARQTVQALRDAHLEVVEVDELVRLRHRLGVLPLCGSVRQILP